MNPLAEIELDDGTKVAGGWADDPAARQSGVAALVADGHDLHLMSAAPDLFEADDPDKSVFLWEAEEKVLGRLLGVWNQNPIGSCVGFGSTRAAQDVLLNEIASGEDERWPGAELCPEVTYVGSRHEARPPGYPALRGEGSFGVAAALWFTTFGAVSRGRYGSVDLTKYNRDWTLAAQYKGIPDDSGIEDEARLHPVTTTARIRSFEDFWVGVGARKGAYFCSGRGFSYNADADGFAVPSGRWGHCQAARGRCVAKKKSKWVRAMVGQNSWLTADGGTVIHPKNGPVRIETPDRGLVTLPPGMVLYDEDVAADMFSEGDSYLLAGFSGWKKLTLDWNPLGDA